MSSAWDEIHEPDAAKGQGMSLDTSSTRPAGLLPPQKRARFVSLPPVGQLPGLDRQRDCRDYREQVVPSAMIDGSIPIRAQPQTQGRIGHVSLPLVQTGA